jgi:hypothetical protein
VGELGVERSAGRLVSGLVVAEHHDEWTPPMNSRGRYGPSFVSPPGSSQVRCRLVELAALRASWEGFSGSTAML